MGTHGLKGMLNDLEKLIDDHVQDFSIANQINGPTYIKEAKDIVSNKRFIAREELADKLEEDKMEKSRQQTLKSTKVF